MTAEEWQRLQAQMVRQGLDPNKAPVTTQSQIRQQLSQPMAPGFLNQSAGGGGGGGGAPTPSSVAQAAQRISGQERGIESQRAAAAAMRGKAMPDGRTVGPSNIYIGPNWGETLGYVANQVGGGLMARGANKKDTALDAQRTKQAQAEAQYAAQLVDEERGYATSEREEGQDFLSGENQLNRGATAKQKGMDRALTESMAKAEREAARGKENREEQRGWVFDNYVIDGKVIGASVNEDLGQAREGSDGPPIPYEVMRGAVKYRPGAEKGTMGDGKYFNDDPATNSKPSADFMTDILTGDYFETGILNPKRWLGAKGIGPDGEFVQATHQRMATSRLSLMANRMEEINLRPWTPQEIKTISADFPTPNTGYSGWAGFTYNTIRKKVVEGFRQAEIDGVTPSIPEQEVLQKIDYGIIEGARKQGVDLMKMAESIGMPRERVIEYLRYVDSLQE